VGGSDEVGETVMREQGVDVMRTEVGRTGDSRRGKGDGGERERHGRPVVGEGGRWVLGGGGSDEVRKTVVREEGVDAMRTEVGRSGEVRGGRRW
jgi:hypothetical protein